MSPERRQYAPSEASDAQKVYALPVRAERSAGKSEVPLFSCSPRGDGMPGPLPSGGDALHLRYGSRGPADWRTTDSTRLGRGPEPHMNLQPPGKTADDRAGPSSLVVSCVASRALDSGSSRAGVTQLAGCLLPKQDLKTVSNSSPISWARRSLRLTRRSGRARLGGSPSRRRPSRSDVQTDCRCRLARHRARRERQAVSPGRGRAARGPSGCIGHELVWVSLHPASRAAAKVSASRLGSIAATVRASASAYVAWGR